MTTRQKRLDRANMCDELALYWVGRVSDYHFSRLCQCSCGRYQRLKFKDITCDRCGDVVKVRKWGPLLRMVRDRIRRLEWEGATHRFLVWGQNIANREELVRI